MASKRAIRRKACTHKKRYLTHRDAVRGISRLRRAGINDIVTVYACRFCGGFHFGHPPAHIRRAMGHE